MWDVFVSHASEDKSDLVFPLVRYLDLFGLKVWYDEFELAVGDSLSRKIDHGLSHSSFGIVVISQAFLKKDWPEYELRGLVAKEMGRDKVILPVWWKVSRDDVVSYSPPLADKVAIDASKIPLPMVAAKIFRVVSPEGYQRYNTNHALGVALGHIDPNADPNNSLELLETARQLAEPWIGNYPQSTIARVKLIRSALLEIMPISVDDWLKAFSFGSAQELLEWERIAATYLEFCSHRKLDLALKADVLKVLLQLSFGKTSAEVSAMWDLPKDRVEEIGAIYESNRADRSTERLYPEEVREGVDKAFVEQLRKAFRRQAGAVGTSLRSEAG